LPLTRLAAAACFALAVATSACGPEPVEDVPVHLAAVGERVVDLETFVLAARTRAAPGEFPRTGAGFEEFRDRLLRDLVVEETLLLEADARGLDAPAGRFEQARREVLEASGDGEAGEEVFPSFLIERFGSAEGWERTVRRRLRTEAVEAAVRAEFEASVVIDDEQVDEALPELAAELTRPARLHARQVFAAEAEKIREAAQALADGVPFEQAAGQYNGGDGDMGWMSVDQAPPVLVESTEGLAVGGMTEIVRSPLGYHLFQVLGREPARPMPEEEARVEVTRRLREVAVDRAWREWLAAKTGEVTVTIHEDVAAELRCCRQGLPYHGDPIREES
jgi:hypothetical protein